MTQGMSRAQRQNITPSPQRTRPPQFAAGEFQRPGIGIKAKRRGLPLSLER
jgi:hypothetical protein